MDLTNNDHIKCPSCGGDQFEKHITGPMRMTKGIIWISPSKDHFACVSCNYIIADPSDLSMGDPIKVYVLGNSLSKQRQGLGRVLLEEGEEPDQDITADMKQMIERKGFFTSTVHGKYTPGRPQDDHSYWVFTDEAWKKAQADPEFNLAEGQHAVEVRTMF